MPKCHVLVYHTDKNHNTPRLKVACPKSHTISAIRIRYNGVHEATFLVLLYMTLSRISVIRSMTGLMLRQFVHFECNHTNTLHKNSRTHRHITQPGMTYSPCYWATRILVTDQYCCHGRQLHKDSINCLVLRR